MEIEYSMADIVYLITDNEQLPRIVVGINVRPGAVTYILNQATEVSEHYGFEITAEFDVLKNI